MAVQRYQFSFRSVELFKKDSLGSGSYGGVCKATCDGLPCAAKILHPTLFDLHDPGAPSYVRKFEEECRLLSSARHPNVVQYLGTYHDPETHLPVLLMEMCDESLYHFLEQSTQPVSYHIQLNIAHDIALALVYLHLNGLTHRDLTANNVLMIAGVRAKVTDFGMSKLVTANPRATPMTQCPGNMQYMPPEALEEPPSYTDKLDVFSFGVLLVQIMTKQFPNPSPRYQVVSVPNFPAGTIRRAVPETERRSSHLRMIADTHHLKAIAISCLKGEEKERPSAQELNHKLSQLKHSSHYTQSLQQAQTGVWREGEVDNLRSQVRDLQMAYQEAIQQKNQLVKQKERELEQLQAKMRAQVHQLEQQLQGQRVLTEAKAREVLQIQSKVQEKERQLQEKDCVILTSEQLIAQFQQTLGEKERFINELQKTMSTQKGKSQQLQKDKQPASDKMHKTGAAAPKNISKLKWKVGKKAMEVIFRGSAVVDGNTVYIIPGGSHTIYSCQITSRDLQWSTLPENGYSNFSLAVVDGVLTSIGGSKYPEWTSSLYSLTERGGKREWSEIFPAMPTARDQTISITTEHNLIVAGGNAERMNLAIVEVMNIATKQWSTVSHLLYPYSMGSGTICGDKLYLAGGCVGVGEPSKSVLTCSVTGLFSSLSLGAGLLTHTRSQIDKSGVWHRTQDLPVTNSTLITLGGCLLAIGGKDNSGRDTATVYCYDTHTDSWRIITEMKNRRCLCLAAAIPKDRLLIVGGVDNDSVEFGSL